MHILSRLVASEVDAVLYLQSAAAIGTNKSRDSICNHGTSNLFVPIAALDVLLDLHLFCNSSYDWLEMNPVICFNESNQRGDRMDETIILNAGRLEVRILGRGKYSLITIEIDARVKYPLYLSV